MANGDLLDDSVDGDPDPVPDVDQQSLEVVTRRLLEVLADDSATMMPPSAVGLDQGDWTELSTRGRMVFVRRHVRSLDPRLVSRAMLRWSGRHLLSRR